MKKQKFADLRVCASCEWIYKRSTNEHHWGSEHCPKCDFVSYGARYVYGDKAYYYARTQKPWFDRQMADRCHELYREIEESRRATNLRESNDSECRLSL